MKIRVEYFDGSEATARVGAAAEVEVERRFDLPFAVAFGQGAKGRLEHFYAMCWAAIRDSGQTELDYDDWLRTVADASQVSDPEEATAKDPTQRARRPAKSSHSA